MNHASHPTVIVRDTTMLRASPVFHVKMTDIRPGRYEEPRVVWDAVYAPSIGGVIDRTAQTISHHRIPDSREFLGFCPRPNSTHKYYLTVRPSDADGHDFYTMSAGRALIGAKGIRTFIPFGNLVNFL